MAYNMDRWRELLPDGWRPSWLPQMPFTDFHQLDLDWILRAMKTVLDQMKYYFIDGGSKETIEEVMEEHPEWWPRVQDGAITSAQINSEFLKEIENAYVTPEMFGAVGDGVADDTNAINQMFRSDAKIFLLTNTYKVSNVTVENLKNAVIMGGTLVSDSHNPEDVAANRNILLTFSKCDRVILYHLNIQSSNDKNTAAAGGFTHRPGSLSSNICSIKMYECRNCLVSDVYLKNILVGVFFDKYNNVNYSNNNNYNIIIQNMIMSGCMEGFHSIEGHNITIDNIKFRSAETPQEGYHFCYFERNTTTVTINNADIDLPEDYNSTVFDFADYYDWDDSLYNQEIHLNNCNIHAPRFFSFRYRNKILRANNCSFVMKKVTDRAGNTYNYSSWFTVVEGTLSDNKYPSCEFYNCKFLIDEDVTIAYFKLEDTYIKADFYMCEVYARITTAGDTTYNACKLHDTLVLINISVTGSCTCFNCDIICENTTQAYFLSCRTTSYAIKFYNCRVAYNTQQYIYNGDADCNMVFCGCYFYNNYPSITIIQSGTGSRATLVNSYLNNTLLSN